MKNSRKFFSNTECEHFPCHDAPEGTRFNCLFCYCPLHSVENCGGDKDCRNCHLPHTPGYYDVIITKLKELKRSGRG
jgi:hypothetical protein